MQETPFEASTVGSMPPANLSDGLDRLFIPLVFGVALFAAETVLRVGVGLSMVAVVALSYAVALWYLSRRPGGLQRTGWALPAAIALLTACYGLFNNPVLQFLNFPLLVGLVGLHLTALTGNRLYPRASAGTLVDALNAVVVLPLVNIPAPFTVLGHRMKAGQHKEYLPVIYGLAIGLPLLLIVGLLLVNADALLSQVAKNLFANFHWSEHFGFVIASLVVTVPLFGLLYALRHGRVNNTLSPARKTQVADARLFATAMALVNAAYLLFILVQFGYLFGAFRSLLPVGFTYADYARRGFGELVVVIVLNLIVLGLSMVLSSREGTGRRFLTVMETALVALTLLLCASELAKMALYMEAYGLTQLRVYVTWFIVLCAVFFVALGIRLYRPSFQLLRFCAAVFVGWYLALNLADMDARIAQYNVAAYQRGQTSEIDIETLYNLSDSAIPYLAVLLDDQNADVANNVRAALSAGAGIRTQTQWETATLARWRGQATLAQRNIEYTPNEDWSFIDPDEDGTNSEVEGD